MTKTKQCRCYLKNFIHRNSGLLRYTSCNALAWAHLVLFFLLLIFCPIVTRFAASPPPPPPHPSSSSSAAALSSSGSALVPNYGAKDSLDNVVNGDAIELNGIPDGGGSGGGRVNGGATVENVDEDADGRRSRRGSLDAGEKRRRGSLNAVSTTATAKTSKNPRRRESRWKTMVWLVTAFVCFVFVVVAIDEIWASRSRFC